MIEEANRRRAREEFLTAAAVRVLPSDEESNKVESQSDRKRAHWQESTSWHSLLGFRQAGRFSLLYAFPSAVVTAHSRFPNVNPA